LLFNIEQIGTKLKENQLHKTFFFFVGGFIFATKIWGKAIRKPTEECRFWTSTAPNKRHQSI